MSTVRIADRKQAEADFHNRRAQDRTACESAEYEDRYPNNKIYSITRQTQRLIDEWMSRHASGATALDYCCGQGLTTIDLARHGATAYGIDIAGEEIRLATQHAFKAGCAASTHFSVMDAEQLTFPDQTFDLIVCNGVLHHLDLRYAYPELARVLKPGGRILCLDALGYNPAIQLYRKLTPHLRTAWEAEHILTMRQVKEAGLFFDGVGVQFFYLLSIAAIPLRNTPVFNPVLRLCEFLDAFVLRIPLVQLMAWQVVFELTSPRSPSRRR